MSIFKESFSPNVRKQLETRQNAMVDRSPKNLQWLNSRNSWIRMSSSVDVDNDGGALAKKYIMQGGILNPNNTLRSGLGDFSNAYSNRASDGSPYRLGIRPMPGITSIDVKSKGAYGSLLATTVNFQCWDIKQLEDLELLYMRPGYTVLVEWGWAPYLDEKNNLSSLIPVNNLLTDATKGKKEDLFKTLKETAQKSGNYEAVLGYVKNFSWSARPDGGYDCTTEIISLGEVLESLKVNYTPSENLTSIITNGLLLGKLTGEKTVSIGDLDKELLKENYTQNILAGIFYELYQICYTQGTEGSGTSFKLTDSKSTYSIFHKKIIIKNNPNSKNVLKYADTEQFYITLESLCDLLNNYVLLRDKEADRPWVELSVKEANISGSADPNTGIGYLLSLAHPLQLSVDPTVCLIKNEKWASNINFIVDTGGVDPTTGAPIVKFPSKLSEVQLDSVLDQLYYVSVPTTTIKNKQAVVDYLKKVTQQDPNTIKALTKRHYEKIKDPNYKVVRPQFADLIVASIDEADIDKTKLNKPLPVGSQTSLFTFLSTSMFTNLDSKQINDAFGGGVESTKSDPTIATQEELTKAADDANKNISEAKSALDFLSKIENHPYFINDDTSSGLGIIGNIYVNIQMLYDLCLNKDLAAQDKKEKNDIGLYDFMKNILSKISNAIGNVNNFELFIEPNGHHARIIDINYADRNKRQDVYKNAFQLEVQNLKSIVRSYKLESKIFPEQSTQIAIAAQTGGGGGIGTDTTTLVGFNKKLTDRLIPEKDVPTSSTEPNPQAKFDKIKSCISILYDFFADIKVGWGNSVFDLDKVNKYEGALKDVIADIINLTSSKIGNRAILPTVFSADLDGIGGIIIGNIFKIDPNFLPKGYKGENGVGSKLGYVVTSLGHKVGSSDWVTSLEGKTIILDDPEGAEANFSNITINLAATTETTAVIVTPSKGATKVINGVVRRNGEIEDLLVPIRQDLYNRHYSFVNQSDKAKPTDKQGRIRLQAKAMQNLEKMLVDAYAAGIYLKVNSAYRTKADQDRVFLENCTNAVGTGKCVPRPGKKPAADPGNSNHGFGLAVDLANKDGVRINIIERIKTPKEWAWIQANKNKYGFANIPGDMWNTSESHHYNFIG